MPKPRKKARKKARKLDAATEQQAIASAQWLIELRRGLALEYSQDYWRFSTKAELRGAVETDERFLQGIKDVLGKKHGEVSVGFIPGPMKWNEKLAAKLIADAKQGNADADHVLREVAAELLTKRIPVPNELADYVAAYLQQPKSSKKQSHKTDYRDWMLALTVDDVARHFKLNHTRNDATEEHCGCSIVADATELHEKTVQNAWHRYQGIADQRTRTNYVAQAIAVLSDGVQGYSVVPPRLCRDRRHIDQVELSIAARQFHALTVMGPGLFEVGEWPCNRNNGLRTLDVGPCGDGGVPLPVKPTAKMKDGIGPDHSSRLEFRFCHCLMPPHALAL